MNPDFYYMHKALQMALRGKGKTSPNPTVGAVIVKNNRIIAEGWHRRAGSDHAEIMALKKAGAKAKGSTLYVTLEPCHHYGRTPPCVNAVIASGIKKVIIGMKDPNPLTNAKSIAKLRKEKIKVKVGVLEKELLKLNEAFVKYIKSKMPFVVAKIAQSLDGKIAAANGHSKWITSQEARQYAHRLRDEFDAILVGINTVVKDNPRLKGVHKRLKKIVVDSQLRISPQAKLFKDTVSGDCFLATSRKAPQKKIEYFQRKGINVLVCPLKSGKVDLKWLLKELAKQEITSILIEGGAHIISEALKAKLVDKMHIYIAPKIVGDQNALSSVVGFKVNNVNRAIKFNEITYKRIGSDIFLSGYVYRNH